MSANGNGAHHLDAVGGAGCKVGLETELAKQNVVASGILSALIAFEEKHREFLEKCEGGYFLVDGLRTLVFFSDQRELVKSYFGPDGWLLAPGPAASKPVDGIKIKLLLAAEETWGEIQI